GIRYVCREWLFGAGHHRHTSSNGRTTCRRLAAHQRNRLGGRTDERHPCVAARGSKVLVLREESVAWMYRVGASGPGGIDDSIDAKVTFARRTRTDRDCLIRHADVARCAIALGIHRHRREAHVTTRAHDAHRDLPAVGDEDLAQNQAILAFDVRRPGADAADIPEGGAAPEQHQVRNVWPGELCDDRGVPALCDAGRRASRCPRLGQRSCPADAASSEGGGRSFGRWVLWVLGVVLTILTTAYASLLLTSEPLTADERVVVMEAIRVLDKTGFSSEASALSRFVS